MSPRTLLVLAPLSLALAVLIYWEVMSYEIVDGVVRVGLRLEQDDLPSTVVLAGYTETRVTTSAHGDWCIIPIFGSETQAVNSQPLSLGFPVGWKKRTLTGTEFDYNPPSLLCVVQVYPDGRRCAQEVPISYGEDTHVGAAVVRSGCTRSVPGNDGG
jgi:hypothetical protein